MVSMSQIFNQFDPDLKDTMQRELRQSRRIANGNEPSVIATELYQRLLALTVHHEALLLRNQTIVATAAHMSREDVLDGMKGTTAVAQDLGRLKCMTEIFQEFSVGYEAPGAREVNHVYAQIGLEEVDG